MKIVLVRHSNAEENELIEKDYDRILIQKGIDKAIRISKQCKEYFNPEKTLFWSSSAPRAYQTAEIFAKEVGYDSTIIKDDFLYSDYIIEDFIKRIQNIQGYDTIWLFGHNPMLLETLRYFTGKSIFHFPKSAVYCISTEDFAKETAQISFKINPKIQ